MTVRDDPTQLMQLRMIAAEDTLNEIKTIVNEMWASEQQITGSQTFYKLYGKVKAQVDIWEEQKKVVG